MTSRRLLYLGLFSFFASCKHDTEKVTDLFPVKTNKLYQFVDRKSNVVIPPQFVEVSRFTEGLALVNQSEENPKWGFIGQTGSYVISPTYVDATTFSEGVAFVIADDGAPTAVDRNGVIKFIVQDAEQTQTFHEGMAACSLLDEDGERWGFIDNSGKITIAPNFAKAGFFSEDMCSVADENGKWGFINKKGVIIIDYQFENVSAFEGGFAKVLLNGKWGVINKDGQYVLQPHYEDISLDGKQFLVKYKEQWSWIDHTSKRIIASQFTAAFPFYKSDLAPVKASGKWGYINRKGDFAVTPQFDFAFCFDGDVAIAASDGKYGLIDKKGQFITPPTFSHVAVDYFIGAFSKTSAYNTVRTRLNSPKHVAYTWLNGFYHFRFDEAINVSTDETKKMLAEFAGVLSHLDDNSKQQMMQVRLGIGNYDLSGDTAVVFYTASDNPGKQQRLKLVKQQDKWRVLFTKDDVMVTKETLNKQM